MNTADAHSGHTPAHKRAGADSRASFAGPERSEREPPALSTCKLAAAIPVLGTLRFRGGNSTGENVL